MIVIPQEIDFDYINRWLDWGDKTAIAQRLRARGLGIDKSYVCKVLGKKAKNFEVVIEALKIAKENERKVLGKNSN